MSENAPNPPEKGLTWLDYWNSELNPELLKWYSMPKREFEKTLAPSPAVQQFIEMTLNPSNMSGTNRMVAQSSLDVRWIDENE